MATLQTIVGNDINCMLQWENGRLSDDRPLTKFYNKFWGVSVEGEGPGCEWRVEESGTAPRSEERMDCDNGEDGELDDGEDMQEDEDVVIEEEEEDEEEEEEEEEEYEWNEEEWKSEEENINIDLIEGCHALNIDIAGIETSIWVRAEYIRLFDHIANLYYTDLSQERTQQKSTCVIVTGQPGIGKSTFLIYAMQRCCAQRQPFIIYRESTCYLFVQGGVFKAPSSFLPSEYSQYIWTLVDADESPTGVPEKLISRGTKHFIVYSTPPNRSRWADVHQTVHERVLVMNPWTRNEILRAASLRLPDPEFDHINKIFNELGPIPRLCIDYDEDELRAYRQDLKEVLDNLSIDNFRKAVTGVEGLNMDAISSKLCLIHRLEQSSIQFSNAVKVLPIIPFIGSRIALQLRNADHMEMQRLYKKFVSHPSTREISGIVFKAYGHGTFTHDIYIRYFPMVRIGGSKVSKNKNQPQWHSTNAKLSPQLLGDKPQAALRKRRDLQLRPWESIQYTSRKLHKRLTIRSDVYYLPAFPNQFGFDSFVVHDNILYLFKFTIKATHDIEDFFEFFDNCTGLPPRKDWRFIFVRPPKVRNTLKCPFQSTDALRDLTLYSTEMYMAY